MSWTWMIVPVDCAEMLLSLVGYLARGSNAAGRASEPGEKERPTPGTPMRRLGNPDVVQAKGRVGWVQAKSRLWGLVVVHRH